MDRRRLIAIFAIVFTNIMGAGMILPVLPLFAEDIFGATPFQATVLAAVFYAAQFVAAPVLGRLSDRVGRRPVLILSQIGTVLSFIMLIFAATLGEWLSGAAALFGITGGLFVFYLARILDGLTFGNITTAQAYITDSTDEAGRTQALGLLGAAFGVGFIFGPGLGGLLAGISPSAPFIGAMLLTASSVLLTTFVLPESLPPEERSAGTEADRLPIGELLGRPTILILFGMSFLFTIAFAAMQSTFSLFAARVAFSDVGDTGIVARNVGIILAFVGFFSVLTQGVFIRPLLKRFGERRVIQIALVSLVVAFAGLAAVSGAIAVTLACAPLAFGGGLIQPSLQSLVTRFGNRRMQGKLLGLFQSNNSLALIIGPIFGGIVFDAISPRAPYALSVPLILVAFALSFVLLRADIPSRTAEPELEAV